MPRSVPFLILDARFAWAMTGFSPCALNSFWQKARAKKPRESSRRSISMMKAPLSLVSVKITTQLHEPNLLTEVIAQGRISRRMPGHSEIGPPAGLTLGFTLPVLSALYSWDLALSATKHSRYA